MRGPHCRGGAYARLGVATTETRYSDEEVALILRKASDLQAQGAKRAEGLDLRTVQDIAREIGVDPKLVELAANQLPTDAPGALAHFFGGGSRYQLRLAHDKELAPDQLRDLAAVIRRALGHQGEMSEVMGALEWKTVGEVSQIAVTIGNSDGGTNVEVIADRSGAAVLTGVGSMSLGLVAGAITGAIVEPGAAIGISIMVGGAAAGAMMTRALWRRSTAKFKQKLNTLTDALQRHLQDS